MIEREVGLSKNAMQNIILQIEIIDNFLQGQVHSGNHYGDKFVQNTLGKSMPLISKE